jgi:hypothetical protein
MEKKTAVQEVFSELEKLHPQLFNVYTTEGKEFLNHFYKFLAIEKEQKHEEYMRGWKDGLTKQGPPAPPLDRKIWR